jgi:hypothetical protein
MELTLPKMNIYEHAGMDAIATEPCGRGLVLQS